MPFVDIEALGITQESVDQQLVEITAQSGTRSGEKIYGVYAQNRDRRAPLKDDTNQMCSMKTCYNCGRQGHLSTSKSCRARGKQCHKCKNFGHFEMLCRKRKSQRTESSEKKQIRMVESVSNENDPNAVENVPNAVECQESPTPDKVYYAFYSGNESNVLTCIVGGISTEMLIDSGADANLISEVAWANMKANGVSVHSSKKREQSCIEGVWQ